MTIAPPLSALAGKTVVVTGASDGVGKAAVRAFVQAGASVVMVGRNEAKTAEAAHEIMRDTGRRTVTWQIADLSDQSAVRALAHRLLATVPQIDVLVNNAGALFLTRETTADGHERTFALNHLSYVTLTLLLLPALSAAARPGAPARVVCVSSRAHHNARPRLDDLQRTRDYTGWRQYADSKLYNIWFTRALARRLDATRLVVQALHPGVVSTRFATNNGRMGMLQRRIMDLISITPERGADTAVWLATADEGSRVSGQYWVKRRRVEPSRAAHDDAAGELLWGASARLAAIDADQLIRDAGLHVLA
jgi:NAD(P)-dependent dehydrogenase (short-subunit alcohol dehydrogenase family)